MDISHSVCIYIFDTKVSILTEQNKILLEITSFCQVIYFGFLSCERKCLSQQQAGNVLENFILNEIYYFFVMFIL